jgi:hypothetical protein
MIPVAVLCLLVFNILVWPPLIYFQNRRILKLVTELLLAIDDGPDPDDELDEPEQKDNIVAFSDHPVFGKRRA